MTIRIIMNEYSVISDYRRGGLNDRIYPNYTHPPFASEPQQSTAVTYGLPEDTISDYDGYPETDTVCEISRASIHGGVILCWDY